MSRYAFFGIEAVLFVDRGKSLDGGNYGQF